MKVYWWIGRQNFGDQLNEWILDRLKVPVEWKTAAAAELVIAGSVLEHLPPGWTGTVCGAGMLREHSYVDLSKAKVLAVRGRLTAARARSVPSSVVLGDPGLLVSRWVPQTVAKFDLGIVPHWSDQTLHKRFPYGRLIDPSRRPGEVITEIANCKRIVSSSLHGIIIADSFGIARRAELFPQAVREGGDFKFRDYCSIYDDHPHFGEFWRAPYHIVEEVRGQLRAVLAKATATTPPRAHVAPPPDLPPRKKGRRPQISLLIPFRHDKEDSEHRERVWHWLNQHWHQQLPEAEIVVGHDGSWPYCVDIETEILTVSGWKSHNALRVGEQVLTLNHATGLSEWQPVEAINVFDVVDEPMLYADGRGHSSFTTLNHRWPVVRAGGKGIRKKPSYKQQISPAERDQLIVELRGKGWSFDRIGEHIGVFPASARSRFQRIERGARPREQRGGRGWTTSEKLTPQDKVPIAAQCADLPTEPKYTDAFVEVVAWAWTEGSYHGRKVKITQSEVKNPGNCERIQAALTLLTGGPADALAKGNQRWHEYADGNNARFRIGMEASDLIRSVAPNRVPSFDFLLSLTRAQLLLFIEVSLLADGAKINSGGHLFAQKDLRAAEAFQFACILAGHATSTYQMKGNTAKYGYDMTGVYLRIARAISPMNQRVCERRNYTGKVWCPTTANGTWLARRRGTVYFTGNSKCRSMNWAATRARGKVLCLLDADAYLNTEVIKQCADNIEAALAAGQKLWYVPYRRLYRLSEDYTVKLLDTDPTLPYSVPSPPKPEWLEPGGRTTINYGYLYGAMAMIMPVEAFFAVGGMDDRFMGWGGEDISFLKSLDTLYGLHEVTDNDICHLWHLRPGKNWKTRLWIGQGAGLSNSRLAQRYSVASGEAGYMRQLADEHAKPAPLSPWYLRQRRA